MIVSKVTGHALQKLIKHALWKKAFFKASRQKIPLLRTQNPAFDTKTIYLPPILIFYNPQCQ